MELKGSKSKPFKAEVIDGKLKVHCYSEEIPNANGGIDIIVHAPSLSIISAFNKKLKAEGKI